MEPADSNSHFDEIRSHLSRLRLEPEDRMKALSEFIPDPKEMHEYGQYILKRVFPHLSNPAGILTPARFIDMVDRINFLNSTEREELLPGLTWDFRPWIPLGYEDKTCYRLSPSLCNLVPHKEEYPSTDLELMEAAFLGVNTTVQPREPSLPLSRRALNLSEQSTQLAELDDAEAPGFVFHELGTLQYLECETAEEMPKTLEEGDDREGDWEETGFSVVARLSNSGHIDGVYSIYNMNPRLEFSSKREKITHSKWGIPPSSPEQQFSCARIGKNMGGFGFHNEMTWEEQIQHPVELVWVVKSPMGGVRRVTVDSNYRMHM